MDEAGAEGFLEEGKGLFRFDWLAGAFRLRLEHRFNGCSVAFVERSSGFSSSLLDGEMPVVGVKRQCAAGGGRVDFGWWSSSEIVVVGILFESPSKWKEREQCPFPKERPIAYLCLPVRIAMIFSSHGWQTARICIFSHKRHSDSLLDDE